MIGAEPRAPAHACVGHIVHTMNISEPRACRALGQHRSTQRKTPRGKADEESLTADLIELARQYGPDGYRKIMALLRDAGWLVNDKRVERIWRREGLKVPPKQPKRGRLWLTDGSCIRLRPEYPNHVLVVRLRRRSSAPRYPASTRSARASGVQLSPSLIIVASAPSGSWPSWEEMAGSKELRVGRRSSA